MRHLDNFSILKKIKYLALKLPRACGFWGIKPVLEAANYAVDLYRHLRKKKITIKKSIDCLIASYAILGNMFIPHNDSDFTHIAKKSTLKIYKI